MENNEVNENEESKSWGAELKERINKPITHCIAIGAYSGANFSRCIVVGDNLTATQELQLLISYGDVQINRIMTEEEFNLLYPVVTSSVRKVYEISKR